MEKFVVWLPEFSVGNAAIDKQHEGLFNLVNTVWSSRKEPNKRKKELFKQIAIAFHAHHKDEELILAANCCEHLERHRREHHKLNKQMGIILDSCEGECRKLWYNMMVFLMHDLLLRHLMEVDMKCRKCLRTS